MKYEYSIRRKDSDVEMKRTSDIEEAIKFQLDGYYTPNGMVDVYIYIEKAEV